MPIISDNRRNRLILLALVLLSFAPSAFALTPTDTCILKIEENGEAYIAELNANILKSMPQLARLCAQTSQNEFEAIQEIFYSQIDESQGF